MKKTSGLQIQIKTSTTMQLSGWNLAAADACAVLYYGLRMMRMPTEVVRETGFMVM